MILSLRLCGLLSERMSNQIKKQAPRRASQSEDSNSLATVQKLFYDRFFSSFLGVEEPCHLYFTYFHEERLISVETKPEHPRGA